MSHRPSLAYFIVCDQLRTETSKKNLFIGAYGTTMVVDETFPAFLSSLSLVACIRPTAHLHKLRVKVRIPGQPSEEYRTELRSENPHNSHTYIINLSPCVFPTPGKLLVEYYFDDHSEPLTGELEVVWRQEYAKASWAKE